MVFIGEKKIVNIDALAPILARTWYLPIKEETTECGVCLPELVEKDFTYFLFGALADSSSKKINSLRNNRAKKSSKEIVKIIFSLLCPKSTRGNGKGKILFSGNPKSLYPLIAASRGIYFEKTLSLSWLGRFKRSGICQRSQFDYFKIGDLFRAFKLKVRLKKLWGEIKEAKLAEDQKLRPAVDYLLNKHFPKLASHLYSTERMLGKERPNWVLVDEDKTEEKRMLIALARNRGIKSAVLMHGAPTRQIGFAPLFADYFITWGEAYVPRLMEWGIPQNKIFIGGSPYHEEVLKELKGRERELREKHQIPPFKKVMLLALNIYRKNPSDDMQGQSISEDQMKTAFDAVVSSLRDGTLIVKPHPRDRNKNKVKKWVSDCHNKEVVYSESDIFELISLSDAVLSPGSTVLLDAVYFGKKAVVLDFFNLPWFDYMDEAIFPRAKNGDELGSILLGEHEIENSLLEKYFIDKPVERISKFMTEM